MARLIDTSVVIAMERRSFSVVERFELLRASPVAIASVTVSELLAGVYRSPAGQRKVLRQQFIDEMVEQFPIYSFDLDAARAHAAIADQLRRNGQPVGLNDTLIAAIAQANGCTVLTDNMRDFERIPGLVVERPSWPD